MLWAVLSMAAALVMTSCSSEDNSVTAPATPQAAKAVTIPYTVTVGDGSNSGDAAKSSKRASIDSDLKTLRFAEGDQLYVWGQDIKGVLDIQTGAGETSGATFSGNLTYTGNGTPSDDLPLTATLVSAQQHIGGEVTLNADGSITVNYPDHDYCETVNEAVQLYANLTGGSTFGEKSFTLEQQTAFLNFKIIFEDGTISGTPLEAKVHLDDLVTPDNTGSVTAIVENNQVVAKFVLPLQSSPTTRTYNAWVKIGDRESISFGTNGKELSGKVYNVTKTQGEAAVTAVDLGLSVLWANKNIGANSEGDYGLYFAWGETIGYGSDPTVDGHGYNWSNYIHCAGAGTKLVKYNSNALYGLDGFYDGKLNLDPEDDAATANWGGSWRMPNITEIKELYDTRNDTENYTWDWTAGDSGHQGWRITYKATSASIFLPAAGYRYDNQITGVGISGYYWSNYRGEYSGDGNAQEFYFDGNNAISQDGARSYGHTVRAVKPKN